ncbi:hypothetical protein RRG08_031682 [Elysia crispata]|uniref:Uncharacterized protein n=1 Tax=Elysia crispata TaxID=231223 RepID=A0AAE1DUS8_9GAST|nr:hypothetical protein RRG08_031682 [Elysia crispata]
MMQLEKNRSTIYCSEVFNTILVKPIDYDELYISRDCIVYIEGLNSSSRNAVCPAVIRQISSAPAWAALENLSSGEPHFHKSAARLPWVEYCLDVPGYNRAALYN